MSASALPSQGVGIFVSNGDSPETFTEITEVVEITGPDGSAAEVDVTDLKSTAKEYKRGLPDNGSIQCNAMYIPTNAKHAQLRSDFNSQTEIARNYQLRYTDSPITYHQFSAYVSQFSISNPADDKINLSFSLRIKGAVTEGTL